MITKRSKTKTVRRLSARAIGRNKLFTLYLTDAERDQLFALAARMGLSSAEYIRRLVAREYVDLMPQKGA